MGGDAATEGGYGGGFDCSGALGGSNAGRCCSRPWLQRTSLRCAVCLLQRLTGRSSRTMTGFRKSCVAVPRADHCALCPSALCASVLCCCAVRFPVAAAFGLFLPQRTD
jgi:hypothetical protein